MARSIKIIPLLRRRSSASILPISGGDDTRSNYNPQLGKHRKSSSSTLVKYMLAFGLIALPILYHNLETTTSSHLRLVTRMYLHKDWRQWRRHTFETQFHCSRHLRELTKSVPTLDYWQTLRDVYNSEVDSSYPFDDPVPPTQGYTLNENGAPPYYAKLSPGKGRSLFASRDIMEGELVDGIEGGTKSDMKFPTVEAMQRYLLALPEPMACDVMEWTYTAELGEGGQPVILCASDISSLMNSAWNDGEDANVMPKEGASSALLYATRDIKEGEEILMNYGVFPAGLW